MRRQVRQQRVLPAGKGRRPCLLPVDLYGSDVETSDAGYSTMEEVGSEYGLILMEVVREGGGSLSACADASSSGSSSEVDPNPAAPALPAAAASAGDGGSPTAASAAPTPAAPRPRAEDGVAVPAHRWTRSVSPRQGELGVPVPLTVVLALIFTVGAQPSPPAKACVLVRTLAGGGATSPRMVPGFRGRVSPRALAIASPSLGLAGPAGILAPGGVELDEMFEMDPWGGVAQAQGGFLWAPVPVPAPAATYLLPPMGASVGSQLGLGLVRGTAGARAGRSGDVWYY